MRRFGDLHRRLGKVAAKKRDQRPAPFVVYVAPGETNVSARARYDLQWPEHGRSPLIVPMKPRTDAEKQDYETRLSSSQRALVNDARRERVATPTTAPRHNVPIWPSSPIIRPNSPQTYWKPHAPQS